MRPNPPEIPDLVTFTEEIFNGKLHFCAVIFILVIVLNLQVSCFKLKKLAKFNLTGLQKFEPNLKP